MLLTWRDNRNAGPLRLDVPWRFVGCVCFFNVWPCFFVAGFSANPSGFLFMMFVFF